MTSPARYGEWRGENEMKFFRLWSGVIASLVISASGAFVSFGEAHIFGLMLMCIGLLGAVWQAWQIRKEQGDPYDLNKLWDSPLPEDIQPEDALYEPDQAYCHRCGHIVPDDFARCPDCGEPVR